MLLEPEEKCWEPPNLWRATLELLEVIIALMLEETSFTDLIQLIVQREKLIFGSLKTRFTAGNAVLTLGYMKND